MNTASLQHLGDVRDVRTVAPTRTTTTPTRTTTAPRSVSYSKSDLVAISKTATQKPSVRDILLKPSKTRTASAPPPAPAPPTTSASLPSDSGSGGGGGGIMDTITNAGGGIIDTMTNAVSSILPAGTTAKAAKDITKVILVGVGLLALVWVGSRLAMPKPDTKLVV